MTGPLQRLLPRFDAPRCHPHNCNFVASKTDMAKIQPHGPARATRAVATLAWLLATGGAAAQHAHRHGAGSLDLSVEGGGMTVQLVLPLEDVVGFERTPRTAEERGRVEAARARLGEPEALFSVPSEAKCRLRSARVDLDAARTTGGKSAHHGDARADYVFDCAKPEGVRWLDVRLFDAFGSVRSVQVQVATPQAQRGARLSADKRRISW